ncbi:MAG: SusC/RagA family TonB-linked outer membrane protein, partial [Owenweeksia sp.]
MKQFYAFCIAQMLCINLMAQHTLTGIVKDAEDGQPIPGATIQAVYMDMYAVTNSNGEFSIKLPELSVDIKISALGYITTRQVVDPKTNEVVISLNPGSLQLDDVVITALGIERDRSELGYSVTEVDPKSLTDVPQTNVVNSLAGQVAGVQVTNGSSGVGSSSRIVIRGENSLSGTNQPLIVVDGVPINNDLIASDLENTEQGIQEVDFGNGLAEINPEDIASISVLKGGGAAALYGSRSGNGVIVINTKRGGARQGLGVSTSSTVTFETPLVLPRYQNTYGGGAGGEFAYDDGLDAGPGGGVNDGGIRSFGPVLDGRLITQFDGPSTDANGNVVRGGDIIARNVNGTLNPITPTAWVAQPDNVRDFFQTGVTYQNNVSVSGGNERSSFRLSYSNLDNTGIIPNTDLQRNGVALSGTQQLSDKFSASLFANYINSKSNNRPGLGYGSENIMYIFNWMGRQNDIESMRDYWQAGQEGFEQFNFNYQWMDNPFLTVYENTNSFDKDRILGNGALTYDFTEKLSLRLRSGIDYYVDQRQFKRSFSSKRWINGAYREDDIAFKEVNTDLLLTYQDRINQDWRYMVSAGANRMNQSIENKSTQAGQLSVPNVYNLENSKIPLEIAQYNSDKRINSLYGIGQISYRRGLFLDLTYRNDWSSTLPAGSESFGYYSASVSYVFNRFMELPAWISYSKARFSVASLGNDTRAYQLRNTLRFNRNYGSSPLVTNTSTLLNSGLRPERQNSLELGGEVWFFKNRLMLDVAAYQTRNMDQIVRLPASAASGFAERVENGGVVRTRGLEAMVQATVIKKDNFSWITSANFTTSRAVVEELPSGVDQYVIGFTRIYTGGDNSVFYIVKEGGRVGDMYGTGIKQYEGRDVYDQNGIPVRDGELQLLGNYNPDFIIGFNNQFRFGPVTFGFLVDWRKGGTIVSRTKSLGLSSGVLEESLEGRENGVIGNGVVNIGTEENPNYVENTTAIPAVDFYNQY